MGAVDPNQRKEARTFAMFRTKRSSQTSQEYISSPFTEMPAELKPEKSSIGRRLQGLLNFLFLLVLGLALISLVLAFAYQMTHNPEALAAWCNQVVTNVQNFVIMLVPQAN